MPRVKSLNLAFGVTSEGVAELQFAFAFDQAANRIGAEDRTLSGSGNAIRVELFDEEDHRIATHIARERHALRPRRHAASDPVLRAYSLE